MKLTDRKSSFKLLRKKIRRLNNTNQEVFETKTEVLQTICSQGEKSAETSYPANSNKEVIRESSVNRVELAAQQETQSDWLASQPAKDVQTDEDAYNLAAKTVSTLPFLVPPYTE